MARRQLQIKGTERKSVPEVEEAAEAYREVRDERMELTRKEKLKKFELLAVMKAHKIKKYKYDDDSGEELLVELSEKEPDVSVKKTGDVVDDDSDVSPSSNGHSSSVPQGLIDQALAAQAEASVVETSDGDVAVPDKAASTKGKRGRKAKKGAN